MVVRRDGLGRLARPDPDRPRPACSTLLVTDAGDAGGVRRVDRGQQASSNNDVSLLAPLPAEADAPDAWGRFRTPRLRARLTLAHGTAAVEVATPQGPGRWHLDLRADPSRPAGARPRRRRRGDTRRTSSLLARGAARPGVTVLRFEQPWRVGRAQGRGAAAAARRGLARRLVAVLAGTSRRRAAAAWPAGAAPVRGSPAGPRTGWARRGCVCLSVPAAPARPPGSVPAAGAARPRRAAAGAPGDPGHVRHRGRADDGPGRARTRGDQVVVVPLPGADHGCRDAGAGGVPSGGAPGAAGRECGGAGRRRWPRREAGNSGAVRALSSA